MAVSPRISKEHHRPEAQIHRHGCPSIATPYYQVATSIPGERTQVVHKYTTMQLMHQSSKGKVKNSLALDKVHHELEINSLALQGSGASNILLSKVSFDCLITKENGETVRDYLPFDLRIPGANSQKEDVFSYDMIEKAYGGKKNLYAALAHFYDVGREKANAHDHKHGHHPEYDHSSSKHDQYIRHTEQLLVAYLALPEGATMLENRLRTEIRGKYPDASSAKVYNMGLHMHSTKTCCSPCEYSLIGLMNDREGLEQNGKQLGFLPNFEKVSLQPNEQLKFSFPKNSLFRLLVTVSTSDTDAHHKTQPQYTKKTLDLADPVPAYGIDVKSARASEHIFSTMLKVDYDRRRLTNSPNLSDLTVGISGSRATAGSPGTMDKVRTIRQGEVDEVEAKMALMKV